MGKRFEGKENSPVLERAMDTLIEQLLVVFLKRLGGSISVPLAEVDDTGQDIMYMTIDENKTFHFEMRKKQ